MKKTQGTKTKKLTNKLSLYILRGLLVVFALLISVIAITTSKDLLKREQDKLALIANENAATARMLMEASMYKQKVIINAVQSVAKNPGGTVATGNSGNLELLKNIISETAKEDSDILSMFLVLEPNALSPGSPNGSSIFATQSGVSVAGEMFQNVSQAGYEKIYESKALSILDPFSKTIDGKEYLVITVLQPILDAGNNVIGAVGSNIDVDILNNAKYETGGYSSFSNQIICGHQTVIVHTQNPERSGKKFLDVTSSTNGQMILDSAKHPSTFNLLDTNTDGEKFYKSFVPFYIGDSPVVWLSESSISSKEFNQSIINQLAIIVFILLLSLLILISLIYFKIRSSLKPIDEIDNAMHELSKGNLNLSIRFKSNDELGSLADSLREAASVLNTYVLDIDRAMGEMSGGNFDLAPGQPFIGDFKGIENSISRFIMMMSSTISQMDKAADLVSDGSNQVASGSQTLAQGTTEQASAVEQLSAIVSEITDKVRSNAESSNQANQMSQAAAEAVGNSNSQMNRLMDAMNEINEKSSEISKIIKTIEDIASQTNILALNAAVEAARAGTAGKGFAVVADEVRNLASKSADAAKNTTVLIESSVVSVNRGVELANKTSEDLLKVVDSAQITTEFIAGISKASNEQADMLTQVMEGVKQISDVVQTNSAAAEESAAASEELSGQSRMLDDLVKKFKIKKF